MPKRKRNTTPRGPSTLEKGFRFLFGKFAADLPEPVTEHKFAVDASQFRTEKGNRRQWRFDFCWPAYRVAIEVEGGIFTGGRHGRGAAYSDDCEKYNAAVILGWRVLRYTTRDMDKRPIQVIEEVAAYIRSLQGGNDDF